LNLARAKDAAVGLALAMLDREELHKRPKGDCGLEKKRAPLVSEAPKLTKTNPK
jgi:hypothetical protein